MQPLVYSGCSTPSGFSYCAKATSPSIDPMKKELERNVLENEKRVPARSPPWSRIIETDQVGVQSISPSLPFFVSRLTRTSQKRTRPSTAIVTKQWHASGSSVS